MSLATLLVRDVTILRAGVTTDYGTTVPTWTNPQSTTTKGWLSQQSRDEDNRNRNAEVSYWHLTVAADTDIQAGDRVEIDGSTFEVDGPPNPAWSPAGVHHIEATLRIVEG